MIRTPVALFAALALVAAACTASDSTSPVPDGSAGFPITIDAPGGPVTLAAATGAPLLPVVCQLTKRGHRFIVGAPMTFDKSNMGDALPSAMTTVAKQLETLLKRDPSQWHVLQPNWPSDPGYKR